MVCSRRGCSDGGLYRLDPLAGFAFDVQVVCLVEDQVAKPRNLSVHLFHKIY